MDIVFICDEEYAIPTAVAIKSIEETNKGKKSIYIVSPSLKEETKLFLKSLENNSTSINVLIYKKEVKEFAIQGLHVSPAAIIKFDLPHIFRDKNKILYLDSDILVRGDITPLFSIDIENNYAAVVKDFKPLTYKPSQLVKLNILHTAYFNSGVMLLNLEKLRKDGIRDKLYKYRASGINYFMDQDALNVIFAENVKYLDLKWNTISSTVGAFNKDELAEYYHLGQIKSKSDIYDQAIIIHLTTKYKPWKFINVPYSSEWMSIYKKLKKTNDLIRTILDIPTRDKIFSGIRVRISSTDLGIKPKVIVNLTSFPERIKCVAQAIRSLQKQTIRVHKIILWLAKEQFANQELPETLTKLIGKDFEIRWCNEDLRPHKKYFYAFKEFSNSINITVDDDIYYDRSTIENLLISYIKYPYAISANRVHRMKIDKSGNILPYSTWDREFNKYHHPSMELFATGVGGVLYPPFIFDKKIALNIKTIIETCLDADDIWLKFNAIYTNTPVVLASEKFHLNFIENSQEVSLWKKNDTQKQNDIQLSKVRKFFESIDSDDKFQISMQSIVTASLNFIGTIQNQDQIKFDSTEDLKKEIEKYKEKINFLKNTTSYRLGRAITLIPRLIIKFLRSIKNKERRIK